MPDGGLLLQLADAVSARNRIRLTPSVVIAPSSMPQVLIVNMPFSGLRWPNLGPSLLKASLGQHGIGCEVAYWNFDFAERLGLERYDWIADHFAFVLGGERLFAKLYFAPGEGDPGGAPARRRGLLPRCPAGCGSGHDRR